MQKMTAVETRPFGRVALNGLDLEDVVQRKVADTNAMDWDVSWRNAAA